MSKYHLLHCIPNPKMHGLNGYIEVIQTVKWGLEQLGHQVSYAINNFDSNATNIVFGAQMLPIEMMKKLPNDTIMYNFEQLRGLDTNQVKKEILHFARHFKVWDYSSANTTAWASYGNTTLHIVPICYAPILSRIQKPDNQDIDILIFGLTGKNRLLAFNSLSRAGLSSVFVSGLYGAARDELISRAKIVLNINLYQHSQIFEIVRVSYLLANRKAVVAILDPGTFVEDDIRPVIKFTTLEKIVDDCVHLLAHEDDRIKIENAGFDCIAKRDIRDVLRNALED
jgi:hypothetical protein